MSENEETVSKEKYKNLLDTTVEAIDKYERCLFMPCEKENEDCKHCIEEHLENGDKPDYEIKN